MKGAQRSFVTQQLADRLHLQPTHHETVSVFSFKAQVPTPNHLGVATMLIHTLSGSRIQISVFIVPKLAVPISVCACLKDIPYHKNLHHAHPVTADENFEISILIGAEFYRQLT